MADEFEHVRLGLHPANSQRDVFAVLNDFEVVFGEVTLLDESPRCAGYAWPLPKETAHG